MLQSESSECMELWLHSTPQKSLPLSPASVTTVESAPLLFKKKLKKKKKKIRKTKKAVAVSFLQSFSLPKI